MSPLNKPVSKLPIFSSRKQQFELFEGLISRIYKVEGTLKILAVDCGRKWPLNLQGIHYHLTGIDLDRDAMEGRIEEHGDLDETFVGDLRTISIEGRQFDVVYNSYVLEHVSNAEAMLDNFRLWPNPGGLMMLRMRERQSVFGFITRITPFWFHAIYKNYFKGRKNAGKPGFGPYPTVYDKIVSRRGMHAYCEKHGLIIVDEFGSAFDYAGNGWLPTFTRGLAFCI